MPQVRSLADAEALLQTSELLTKTIRTVISEWNLEANNPSPTDLPSPELYSAQKTIISIAGQLLSSVQDPGSYIIERAYQYWESRALYICASLRIPDLLASAPLPVVELAALTGVESRKLARLMRSLCSLHIFQEVSEDVFGNNRMSEALVGNEPLRAYVLLTNGEVFTAADKLPKYLLGEKGHSFKVDETPFQEALGTPKSRWEWLEEDLVPDEVPVTGLGIGYSGLMTAESSPKTPTKRPELEVFGLAMLGGGRVFGAAHPYDYPWEGLGKATIVDVGGGVGGFVLQLSKLYSQLKFVVQDRQPVLQQAETLVWPKENPSAITDGRVTFMPHDFFQTNPVKDADIYWLRYILHDWSDEYCIQILSGIRNSITSTKSRILICDQVMNTTLGCAELTPAPTPLPANYGYYTRYSHQRDLAMMGTINGIERTPAQFGALVDRAGLTIEKIWECRSQVSIVELKAVFD